MRRFDFLNHGISNVHAAALLLGAAGFLSRLLGMLRDRMLTAKFGAGSELDIYFAAFQIPDLLSVVFLLGAASSAILPIFLEYQRRSHADAQKLIAQLLVLFFCTSSVIAAVAYGFAPALMRYITPGFSVENVALAVSLTRVILLSPILLGLSAILSSVAESYQRFWAYALAPIFYNIGIIFGIAALVPLMGVQGLGVGVALGAGLHFLVQARAIKDLGFSPVRLMRFIFSSGGAGRVLWSRGVARVATLSLPRVLSVSLSQLTMVALVALGSTLAQGSIAVFTLAQNLYFVPLGIFSVGYTIALFPRMSRAYLARDGALFFHELFMGVRSILFWIIPSAAILLVLRAHVVRVALGAGAFSWEDTRLTTAAFALFLIALSAASLVSLFIKGFYALENTWLPLLTNMGGSLVALASAWWAVHLIASRSPWGEILLVIFRVQDIPHPEALGLAVGFAAGMLCNIVPLYLMLMRLARQKFGMRARFPTLPLMKIVMAALAAAGAAWMVRMSFSSILPLTTFLQVFIQGIGAGAVGALMYIAALMAQRSEDIRSLRRVVPQHIFSLRVLPKQWEGDDTKV